MTSSFTRKAVAVLAVSLLGSGFGVAGQIKHYPPFFSGLQQIESWSSCTAFLCIDAPPQGPQGLDGSGGWGWNSSTNAPVTSLTVGTPATFTVTMLQPSNTPLCNLGGSATTGSITLTYSSQDFILSPVSSRGASGSNPFDRGGVMTFPYTGDFFCHGDQSDSFTFTPQNPTNTALVTATINVNNALQVSETFPVAITKPR